MKLNSVNLKYILNVTKYTKCNTILICVEDSKCRKAIDFAAFLVYPYDRS